MTKIFQRVHTILIRDRINSTCIIKIKCIVSPKYKRPLVNDCADGLLRLLPRRGGRGPCHIALLPFVSNPKYAWLTSTNSVSVFFLI